MDQDQVVFEVSGQRFSVERRSLRRGPQSLLKTASEHSTDRPHVYNKPPEVFGAIVSFYQTGELHIPPVLCPGAFINELKFWKMNITPEMLPSCCSHKLKLFLDEQKTIQKFQQHYDCGGDILCGVSKFRGRLWAILDYRERSILSRIFFTLALLMVLVSIFTLAFSTDAHIRNVMSNCHQITNAGDVGWNDVLAGLHGRHCSFAQPQNNSQLQVQDISQSASRNVTLNGTHDLPGNQSIANMSHALPHSLEDMSSISFIIYALVFAEMATLVFFTLEFILRLASCPDIRKYFKSVINIIDAAALIGTYLHMLILRVQSGQTQDTNEILDVLEYMQMLRSFRLFRIVKNIKASRVLAYSLRQNLKDLSILALFLAVCTCTFASLVYIFEDKSNVASVPIGWYWAVITMTTVGYGDVTPKSKAGRLVGCVCATFGVMLFALTVPLFANRFITLYNYICLENINLEKELRASDSEERRETETTTTVASDDRNGFGHA